MKETNPSLIILGQTAVGKTALAIELAKELNGEIISADSMQVYKGMDIGTAKPTLEERKSVKHHLIDIKNPDEEWTVSDFIQESKKIILDLSLKRKFPVLAGGTGLYLWSFMEGFSFPIVEADFSLRKSLQEKEVSALYEELKKVDPESLKKINKNDKKRIIRALEVFILTGKPISHHQEEGKQKKQEENNLIIGISMPKDALYEKINFRVDLMIEKGLIDEVKNLLNKFPKTLPSFKGLGYKETIEYIEGRWTKDQMIEELKKRTRNFARRQMTWFKRFKDVSWFEANDNLPNSVISYLHERARI